MVPVARLMASDPAFRRDRVRCQSIISHGAPLPQKRLTASCPTRTKSTDALRAAGVTPGPSLPFPALLAKEMKSPEVGEKFKRGPVGLLTVMPSGAPAMGKYLGLWFVNCWWSASLSHYLTGRTRVPGTQYLEVFRVGRRYGGFMGYGVGQLRTRSGRGRPGVVTAKHVFDGLVYALLTAGTFGWLWPR